jgi:ADP-ribosylglycohydrolase
MGATLAAPNYVPVERAAADDDPTLDRYRGCLLGVALGDALGAPYEFSSPPFEVAREFRPGVFGTAPGHPTDDSTLAAACAEALLEAGRAGGAGGIEAGFAAGYVRRLVAWATSDPPDIGIQTRRAVDAWQTGHPPPADEAAQGNGSLMAVAPVGLRFAGEPEAARAIAAAFARLTHPSAAAVECNVTYAGLLAAAVRGAGAGDLDAGVAPAPPGAEPAGAKKGWCRLTLHLAVRALENATAVGPFEALVSVIALGGDTDTNAAVAGGLLGAAHGASAWPAHLLDGLALRPRLEQLATELWRAAQA